MSNILTIAQQRFEHGNIAKSELLRAVIEDRELRAITRRLHIETLEAKKRLLLLANLSDDEMIDGEYTFVMKNSSSLYPLIELTRQEEKVAQSELKLASHTIENIELFSELEHELDQDVFRVGVAIELPIFNQKSQEKQLAKIAIQNQKITVASQERALALELPQLEKQLLEQEELKRSYETLISEQTTLLNMYQEAYAVAKANLTELQKTKRKLFQSKSKLLALEIAIEQNIIKLNYLKGANHE